MGIAIIQFPLLPSLKRERGKGEGKETDLVLIISLKKNTPGTRLKERKDIEAACVGNTRLILHTEIY